MRPPATDDAQLVPAAGADLSPRNHVGASLMVPPKSAAASPRPRIARPYDVDGQRPMRAHLPDGQEECHGRDSSTSRVVRLILPAATLNGFRAACGAPSVDRLDAGRAVEAPDGLSSAKVRTSHETEAGS